MEKFLYFAFFYSSNTGDTEIIKQILGIFKQSGIVTDNYTFSGESVDFVEKETRKFNKASRFRILLSHSNIISLFYYLLNKFRRKERSRNLVKKIKESKGIIFGGGNMLLDINPIILLYIRFIAKKAKKFNKPVHFIYIGAGPLRSFFSRLIVTSILRYTDSVHVRDDISYDLLNKLTNNKDIIKRTIDPVLFNSYIDVTKKEIKEIKFGTCIISRICFDSNDDYSSYLDYTERLIVGIYKEFNNSKFILFSTDNIDYDAVNFIGDKLKNSGIDYEIIINVNTLNIEKIYSGFDYLLGGRMHSLIFSQKYLVPYIGIIWQSKLIGYGKVSGSSERLINMDEVRDKDLKIIQNIVEDILNIDKVREKMAIKNRTFNDEIYNAVELIQKN
jgi:polysaccharide pyruvyl transferase WcaK-like protein